MSTQFCQENDVGLQLIYQFVDVDGNPINIAAAQGLTLKLGYPDGTSADKTATLLTDGTDGKIYYITLNGDLNQFGSYKVQGKFSSSGKAYSGQEVPLQVYPNVDNN